MAFALQHSGGEQLIDRIVLSQQDIQAHCGLVLLENRLFGYAGGREVGGEVESASVSSGAVGDPDFSAHEPDQARRDGEAQTRTAKPASGRVFRLRERIEDKLAFLCRNANAGIDDGEFDPDRVLKIGRASCRERVWIS